LCQSESFPATTEAIGKGQLRINESPLLGRQSQEISRVTDDPAGAFQLSFLLSAHLVFLS
jgi:hypothetical protein